MEEWKNGKMEEILPRRHGGHGNASMERWKDGMVKFLHIPKLPNCLTADWRLATALHLTPHASCLTPNSSFLRFQPIANIVNILDFNFFVGAEVFAEPRNKNI